MAKHIDNSEIKRLLSRRGIRFVEKNHPEAVQRLKGWQRDGRFNNNPKNKWDIMVRKYAE